MLSDLHGQGIETVYRNVDGPDLSIQRDMLAADFLRSGFTHLLLIDGEMSFAPGLCASLLGFRKEVIGAAYAMGSLNLARFEQHLKTRSFEAARALSCDWKVRLLDGTLTVQNGIGRVEALGPSFLLIARSALAQVAADDATPTYKSPAGENLLPGPLPRPDTRQRGLSHDHVFCARRRALGGETWVYPQAEVRRIAEMRFGMPYRRFLEATLATARSNAPGSQPALAPESGA
jgi:hypothetical protein